MLPTKKKWPQVSSQKIGCIGMNEQFFIFIPRIYLGKTLKQKIHLRLQKQNWCGFAAQQAWIS